MNSKHIVLMFILNFLILTTNVACNKEVEINIKKSHNLNIKSNSDKTEKGSINKLLPKGVYLESKIRDYHNGMGLEPPIIISSDSTHVLEKISETCYSVKVVVEYDFGTAMAFDELYYRLEYNEENGWNITEMYYQ